jgi:hypothetical protein
VGNPYVTTSVYGGDPISNGEREGGGGVGKHLATCNHSQHTQDFRPGAGTTRRCPVHWAAAVFHEETTATSQNTLPGLASWRRTTRRPKQAGAW